MSGIITDFETLAEKAARGESLKREELRDLAGMYRTNTQLAVEHKRAAAQLEKKASALRKNPTEAHMITAETFSLEAVEYKARAADYMHWSEKFHRALLNTPGGEAMLTKTPIVPDQGTVNNLVKEAEEKARERIAELESMQRAEERRKGEGRGGRSDRREERREERKGSHRLKGKGVANVEGAEDAAMVLARLEHGESDKGSGVVQRKSQTQTTIVKV